MAQATEHKEETGGVTGAVKQVASAVSSAADRATTVVGSGMESLAGTIRDHTPHDGMIGSASGAVADTLASGGRYLQEHSPADMFNDMGEMIRKNPMTCLMVGLGFGFLMARMLKR